VSGKVGGGADIAAASATTSKYLSVARRCGEATWRYGLLRKGPGICHGISGSGYAMLCLYKTTREPVWLHRACAMGDFMFQVPL
jgi:hypothetical protein